MKEKNKNVDWKRIRNFNLFIILVLTPLLLIYKINQQDGLFGGLEELFSILIICYVIVLIFSFKISLNYKLMDKIKHSILISLIPICYVYLILTDFQNQNIYDVIIVLLIFLVISIITSIIGVLLATLYNYIKK